MTPVPSQPDSAPSPALLRAMRRGRIWQRMRPVAVPVISALLILGVWGYQSTYEAAQEYDEYHAACQAAVEAIPLRVGHWMGREVPLPQPALELLDPNALRHIRFTDYGPAAMTGPDRRVSVIIVQCRRARDMLGHYPPQCYPAHGAQLIASEERNWTLADNQGQLLVQGMEYTFAEADHSGRDLTAGLLAQESWAGHRRRVVLNFMIVPGVGIVRDMTGVSRAAEDYQQRHRGAAQVQVVFDPSTALLDRAERDAILVELLTPALPALRALMDVSPDSPQGGFAESLNDRPFQEMIGAPTRNPTPDRSVPRSPIIAGLPGQEPADSVR